MAAAAVQQSLAEVGTILSATEAGSCRQNDPPATGVGMVVPDVDAASRRSAAGLGGIDS